MTTEIVIIIFLLITICLVLAVFVFLIQQRLINERFLNTQRIQQVYANHNFEMAQLKTIHEQELAQLKSLYPSSSDAIIPKPDIIVPKVDAAKQAREIINTAEVTAKSIIAEAQEKAKLLLQKEEKNLQKSIVKIVIQVVKKVLSKTLTYEDHKQIIFESLEEIN